MLIYTLFHKQHFYKQRQAEIGKKLSKSLETPWGWYFAIYLNIIYILKLFIILSKWKIDHLDTT